VSRHQSVAHLKRNQLDRVGGDLPFPKRLPLLDPLDELLREPKLREVSEAAVHRDERVAQEGLPPPRVLDGVEGLGLSTLLRRGPLVAPRLSLIEDRLQGDAVVQAVASRPAPAQLRQVPAAAEQFADVVRERSDVVPALHKTRTLTSIPVSVRSMPSTSIRSMVICLTGSSTSSPFRAYS
jgi:hypothetical protein